MYIVTKPFYDLTDVTKTIHTKDGDIPQEHWLYKPDDVYPRDGAIPPTDDRIRELASDINKQGVPLITWVEPEPEMPQSDAEPEITEDASGNVAESAQSTEADEKPAETETPAEIKEPARKAPEKAPTKRTPARKKAST